MFVLFVIVLFLSAVPAYAAYGPAANTDCRTTGDIIVPDQVANPETAVENNTNSVILIKAGTYNVTNFAIGNGNTVLPYDCQSVTINASASNTFSNSNWTVKGIVFDFGNVNNGGFRMSSGSNNILIEAVHIKGETQIEAIGNARNITVRNSRLTGCPNCATPEGNKLDDSGADGPWNVLIEGNLFEGNPAGFSQNDIHDMWAIEGLGDQGTLKSELNPDLGNFSAVFRHNLFTCETICGENFFDTKVTNGGLSDQGRALWEQNTLRGPMHGQQQGEVMGNCFNFGDEDCPGGSNSCPRHVITHNFMADCMAPDETPSSEKRSEWISGGSRYSSILAEFNVINNRESLTQGAWSNMSGVTLRHNSYFGDTARYAGSSCSDSISGAGNFVLTLSHNVYVNTHTDMTCSAGGDWSVNDNLFFNTSGNEFEARWNSGNLRGTNPQYADVSNDGAGNLTNDFTITATGTNPNGVPLSDLGAMGAPRISNAVIADTGGGVCVISVTFQDSGLVASRGYSHMPMSAVDDQKITVEYDDVGQTISSSQVNGNDVELTMQSCPSQNDVVELTATYGWCRDSADIGDLDDTRLTAGCLAVTNLSVFNDAPPVGPVRLATPSGSDSGDCQSTPCHLQRAMDQAQCGDTVSVADGTYSNGPYVYSTSCTGGSPDVVVTAPNRFGPVLLGGCPNSPTHSGGTCSDTNANIPLRITGDGLTVEYLTLRAGSYGVQVQSSAQDITIQKNLIRDFRYRGLSVDGDNVVVKNNVIGYYEDRESTSQAGQVAEPTEIIRVLGSASGFVFENNIALSIGDKGNLFMNGHAGFGSDEHTSGRLYGLVGSAPQSTVRGNILMWGRKGGIDIIQNENEHQVHSNIIAYSTGAFSARDKYRNTNICASCPTEHVFENNLSFSNEKCWGGKGNENGQNKYRSNTCIITEFSANGVDTGNANGHVDEAQEFRSNGIFNITPKQGGDNKSGLLVNVHAYTPAFSTTPGSSCENGCKTHNFYHWLWPGSNVNNWVHVREQGTWAYTLGEIANPNTAPIFEDQANGDYRLASNSPGFTGSHTGGPIGITADAYLTVAKMNFVAGIHNSRVEVATSGTSGSISGLDASRWWSVWLRYPATGSCSSTSEVHTIEGIDLQLVDYAKFKSEDFPYQNFSGDAHRWMPRGEYPISSDGVLNVQWQTSNCVDRIAAFPVPTPEEAFCAVNSGECESASAPQNLVAQTGANPGEITLQWSAVSGATEYRIKEATVSGGSLTQVGTSSQTNFTRSGLGNNVFRCYRVTAVVTGQESETSNESCAQTRTVLPYIVNAGGNEHTDAEGNVWVADNRAFSVGAYGFIGGNTQIVSDPIAGTSEDPIFQSERWGLTGYSFTIDPGVTEVDITLHFNEMFHTAVSQRVFDVLVEGQIRSAVNKPAEFHQTDFLTIPDCQGTNIGTTFYPTASPAERSACRSAVLSRGYTDWYLSITSGDHDFFGDVSGFRALLSELVNDGIRPVVWLTSDTGNWKEQSISAIQSDLTSFIPQIDDLVSSYVLGIEIDEYWSLSESTDIATTMQGLTDRPIGMHQGPYDTQGSGSYDFCKDNSVCDYMVLQYGTSGLTTGDITTITNAVKADLGTKPLVAGEYNVGGGEALSISLGNAAIDAGAMGFGNGGTSLSGGGDTTNDIDLIARAGHDTAYTMELEAVEVLDGQLDLVFSASANEPQICGIHVRATNPVEAPAAPTNLVASHTPGSGEINLDWDDNSPAPDNYSVKRATVSGGPYTSIGTPTNSAFTDSNVVDDTTYFYVVTAVTSGVESAFSNEDSATPVSASSPVLTQTYTQFYRKHLGQGLGVIGAPNENIALPPNATFTFRAQVQATAAPKSGTVYALYGRRGAGSYKRVTADCTIGAGNDLGVCFTDNLVRTDGTALGNRLPLNANITYESGGVFRETDTALPSLAIGEDRAIELEFSLRIDKSATTAHTFDLRIEQTNGTDLDAYTFTPRISVGTTGAEHGGTRAGGTLR